MGGLGEGDEAVERGVITRDEGGVLGEGDEAVESEGYWERETRGEYVSNLT